MNEVKQSRDGSATIRKAQITIAVTELKQGFKAFIPVDRPFTSENAEQVKKLFSVPNRASLIEFISSQDIIPEDLSLALENVRRIKAINEYEKMLKKDLVENDWQKWFEDNTWVLGSEFVRVLDERHIDVQNISDFGRLI